MASASEQKTEKSSLLVYLKDLSGSGNDPEIVGGFESDKQAFSFARAYLYDSIERCRVPGAFGNDVLESWKLFGEDVEVKKGDEIVWNSEEEVAQMVKVKAQRQECNWRELDPRAEAQPEDAQHCACGHEHACDHGCDHHHDEDDFEDNNEIMVGL
ncbi:hypothetical protein FAI41_08525 [Acetobacteraceae bacterium]|nr:hypothetical protein FAI41_08525 [Acetobacteraceae bacterium]